MRRTLRRVGEIATYTAAFPRGVGEEGVEVVGVAAGRGADEQLHDGSMTEGLMRRRSVQALRTRTARELGSGIAWRCS